MRNNRFNWDTYYWETQSTLVAYDPRFNYDCFATISLDIVKSRARAIQREKNSLQISSANLAQLFFNTHRSENAPALESYINLLPYPLVEQQATGVFKNLTRKEALEVLSLWENLPFLCQQTLKDYYSALVILADI